MPHGADAQPDVRRVGGGRARTSPPPTAQHKPAAFPVPCVSVILGTRSRNARLCLHRPAESRSAGLPCLVLGESAREKTAVRPGTEPRGHLPQG